MTTSNTIMILAFPVILSVYFLKSEDMILMGLSRAEREKRASDSGDILGLRNT
jgi:hypothetical protein